MAKVRGARTPKLGHYIKQRREDRRGLTVPAVSARLKDLGVEVSRSQLWKIEEEGQPPDVLVLWGLSEVLRVDLSSLCLVMVGDLLGRPIASAEAPRLPSDEALAVAHAFDESDSLRAVIRSLLQHAGSDPGEREQPDDRPARARGGRGRS